MAELFSTSPEVEKINQREFLCNLYKTFRLFGWKINKDGITKVSSEDPPFDSVSIILSTLVKYEKKYFTYLFILAICNSIFNYGYKDRINWETFEEWLKISSIFSPNQIKFLSHRWNSTTIYPREKILTFLEEIHQQSSLEQSIKNYEFILEKSPEYPEIQVIRPIINPIEKTKDRVRMGKYTPIRRLEIFDHLPLDTQKWWLYFTADKVVKHQELHFPELIYFSDNGIDITQKGAVIITNIINTQEPLPSETSNFISITLKNHSKSVSKPFTNYSQIYLDTIFSNIYSGLMMAKMLGAEKINILDYETFNNFKVIVYTLLITAVEFINLGINFWGVTEEENEKIQEAIKIIQQKKSLLGAVRHPFKGLVNIGSSCYMDSVMFSLLYKENPVIETKMLNKKVSEPLTELQNELKKIQRSIRGNDETETCADFRKILKKIPNVPTIFTTSSEQDAGEFYLFLMDLFKVYGAHVRNVVFGTNDLGNNPVLTPTSDKLDKNESLVNFIDSFSLKESSSKELKSFLNKRSDSVLEEPFQSGGKSFIRRISIIKLVDVPDFYSFYIQRADPITNLVLTRPIFPNPKLEIAGKNMELDSIVVHMGSIDSGHYVTFFRYENYWYLYNDVSRNIKRIGNFEQVLEHNYDPLSHGIIYFYSKK